MNALFPYPPCTCTSSLQRTSCMLIVLGREGRSDERESQDKMNDSALQKGEPVTPPTKEAVKRKYCAKCQNHQRMEVVKGHKRHCSFKWCRCVKCRCTDEKRKITARNVQMRREELLEREKAAARNMNVLDLNHGVGTVEERVESRAEENGVRGDFHHSSKAFPETDNSLRQVSTQKDVMYRKEMSHVQDGYRKMWCAKKTISGQENECQRPWKCEVVMSFQSPYLPERNQIPPNIDCSSEDSHMSDFFLSDMIKSEAIDSHAQVMKDKAVADVNHKLYKEEMITSTTSISKAENLKCTMEPCDSTWGPSPMPISDVLMECFQNDKPKPDVSNFSKPNDVLGAFFKTMEETVKTFPIGLIIEIKGKIAALVNEYEMINYLSQNRSSSSEMPSSSNAGANAQQCSYSSTFTSVTRNMQLAANSEPQYPACNHLPESFQPLETDRVTSQDGQYFLLE